ncbi:GntR family transcriptional regulator [Streptomyces sp. NPDC087532]|uniref:GntR family transcriptional regulator n=1 Tax=Streptomyces sp. NPDC087532 TaxID=3365795 RepID=UPI0037F12C82
MTNHQPRKRMGARDIAADLLSRIESGDIEDQFPPTRVLTEDYGTSPETLRQAIQILRAEGRVTSQQGKGVFVRRINPIEFPMHRFEHGNRRDDAATGIDEWKAAILELGRTPSQDVPHVSVERAPAEVAKWLAIEAGTFVVARRRIRRVDDKPFQLTDSWFPTEVALDTPLMDEKDVTMPGGILANIKDGRYAQQRKVDKLRAWTPTADEAERLGLPTGSTVPVLRHVRIGYNEDGLPVRCMVTIAPGDLNTLVYEIKD